MISKICQHIAKIEKDKLLHFIIPYIIFDFCLTIISKLPVHNILNIIISIIITSIFVIGKEIIDKIKYNGFDWKDILAGYIAITFKLILFIILIL